MTTKLTTIGFAALLITGATARTGVASAAPGDRTWSIASTGNTGDLIGIWGSGKDNVYAAGRDGAILRSTDGGMTWTRRGSQAAALFAIGGSGAESVYAMGAQLFHTTDGGIDWSSRDPGIEQPATAVWAAAPYDVYVVGVKGAIRHSVDGGRAWATPDSGTTNTLNAVWSSGPNDVYVAGEGGLILHSDDGGNSWVPQTSGTARTLYAMWGSGKDDVYAVGDDGEVLHTTNGGGTWTGVWKDKTPLSHIWGNGKKDIYIATGTGLLHTADGKRFMPMKTGTDVAINGIWGSGPGDVYLAGDKGLILHSANHGKTWEQRHGLKGPGQEVLRSVWGTSEVAIVAGYLRNDGAKVSHSGHILRSENGAPWTTIYRLPSGALEGVWGSGQDNIYAVGEGGTILHGTDGGKSWSPMKTSIKTALRGVWGSGADDVYAVGDKGTILHTGDGGHTWAVQKSGTKLDVHAVWGSGKDDVYAAAGDSEKNACAILRSGDGGKTWKTVYESAGNLFAVAGGGGGGGKESVYVVGSDDSYQSRVLHSVDGGVKWTAGSGSAGVPHGVWIDGAGVVYLASSAGAVLRSADAGKTWKEDKTGTTADLEGIWGSGPADLVAVGRDGVLLRTARP